MWELRGEGSFWSFMFGSGSGRGGGPRRALETFLPLLPRRREPPPNDPGHPWSRLGSFLAFVGLILRGKKKLKCFGDGGGAKDEEISPLLLEPLFPFDCGGSHTRKAGFSGLRGAPALPKQQRTKGRRPCWHHDAAPLQPAARAPPLLPAAHAPPSQTRVLF